MCISMAGGRVGWAESLTAKPPETAMAPSLMWGQQLSQPEAYQAEPVFGPERSSLV